MAIGVHELGNMSERRIERLCNPSCSELPSFLAVEGTSTYYMVIDILIHFKIYHFLRRIEQRVHDGARDCICSCIRK